MLQAVGSVLISLSCWCPVSSSSRNRDSWVAKVPWKMLAKLAPLTPNPPVEIHDFVSPELLQKFSNLVTGVEDELKGTGLYFAGTCSLECMK
jgi:hypothetical protein